MWRSKTVVTLSSYSPLVCTNYSVICSEKPLMVLVLLLQNHQEFLHFQKQQNPLFSTLKYIQFAIIKISGRWNYTTSACWSKTYTFQNTHGAWHWTIDFIRYLWGHNRSTTFLHWISVHSLDIIPCNIKSPSLSQPCYNNKSIAEILNQAF